MTIMGALGAAERREGEMRMLRGHVCPCTCLSLSLACRCDVYKLSYKAVECHKSIWACAAIYLPNGCMVIERI